MHLEFLTPVTQLFLTTMFCRASEVKIPVTIIDSDPQGLLLLVQPDFALVEIKIDHTF